MKTTFKTNLLHHLIAKKEEGGFTLIELLVVIIIIGILAAIALPSFLNQANKARQSEAKTYVGSMNRAQQAFYLENNSFSEALGSLGLGIPEVTDNYKYEAATDTIDGLSTALSRSITWSEGVENKAAATRAYVGGVSLTKVPTGTAGDVTATDTTTVAILCEANSSPVNDGPTGAAGTITTKDVTIKVAGDTPGTTKDGTVKQPECTTGWSGV